LGADILKQYNFNASEIDLNPYFQNITKHLDKAWNMPGKDLLSSVLNRWNACVEHITSSVNNANLTSFGKAHLAYQINGLCTRQALNEVRDRAYRVLGSALIPQHSFEYEVGEYGNQALMQKQDLSTISGKIIADASKKWNVNASYLYPLVEAENVIDNLGTALSNMPGFGVVGNSIKKYPTTGLALALLGSIWNLIGSASSGSICSSDFAVRSVKYPFVGFLLPQVYNLVFNTITNMNPIIYLGAPLGFLTVGGYTGYAFLTTGFLGSGPLSLPESLLRGSGLGSLTAAVVAGIGFATDAAHSLNAALTNTIPVNPSANGKKASTMTKVGKAIGGFIGKNPVGRFVENHPNEVLSTTGGAVGLAGRVAYLWRSGQAVKTGLIVGAGLAITAGAVAVGTVALPVIAGGAYYFIYG
jgi:hypothetical protein